MPAKSGWSRMRWSIVGTRNAVRTWCSCTSRNHSAASNRSCTTEVLPEYRLPSMPSEPPTWKNGTHIIATVGAESGRNGCPIPRIRALSCPLVIPTAFGSPVVPLVNSTRASRSSISSAVFAAGIGLSLNRSAAVNALLAPASRSRSAYASPATADVGASRILHQGPQLRWRERRVHQRRRSADACRAEHRCDGKQAAAVDDGDAGSGRHTVGSQSGGAAFDGRRQLAVADRRACR